jgi:hypothetical protein
MGISIRLDKANVRLNHWAFISNPVPLRVLISLKRTFLERLGVRKMHVFLVVVGRILSSLLMVASNDLHLLRMVTINQLQFMAFQ